MAQTTLLPNTASVSTGTGVFVSTNTTQINLEFVPQTNSGFSGTVVIESATAAQPTAGDWFTIATLAFSAHTQICDINLYLSNNPWIRARISAATAGSITIHMAY